MKHMTGGKNITMTAVLAASLLLLFSLPSYGQGVLVGEAVAQTAAGLAKTGVDVATDAAAAAAGKTDIKILEQLKKLKNASQEQWAKELKNTIEMIANMEKTSEALTRSKDLFEATYNGLQVAEFFSKSTDKLENLYKAYSQATTAYRNLNSMCMSILSYGDFDEMTVYTALMTASSIISSGETTVDYIKALLKTTSGLTAGEIGEAIDKGTKELQNNADHMSAIASLLVREQIENGLAKGMSNAVREVPDKGGSGVKGGRGTKATDGTVSTDEWKKAIKEESTDSKSRMTDQEKKDVEELNGSLKTELARKIMSIVEMVIGIMAAAYLAVNFWRKNKGERQSNDSLFKTMTGFVISLLAIEIVKLIVESLLT